MTLIAAGFNHQTTPLDILGRIIIPQNQLHDVLKNLIHSQQLGNAVIISTCNRCEIYAETGNEEVENLVASLIIWFSDYSKVERKIIEKYFFIHTKKEAIHHLMRVSSSIDSMMIGEPQILGQVKAAYQLAQNMHCTTNTLSHLFEKSFSIAKHIRHHTELGKYTISYASTVVKLAHRIFEKLHEKQVLFIGTGDMIESTIHRFHSQNLGLLTIAGRSTEKVRALAERFSARHILISQMEQQLHCYDIIISCTASPDIILTKTAIQAALVKRKHLPLCIADMAVPNDIENTVGEIEDVYLYTLEKLATVIDHNQEARMLAAKQAETIIQDQATTYYSWLDTQKAAVVITQLRDDAEAIREQTLKQAIEMLHAAKPTEEVLTHFSVTLTKRLLHMPTKSLNQLAEAGHFELLEIINQLLKQKK